MLYTLRFDLTCCAYPTPPPMPAGSPLPLSGRVPRPLRLRCRLLQGSGPCSATDETRSASGCGVRASQEVFRLASQKAARPACPGPGCEFGRLLARGVPCGADSRWLGMLRRGNLHKGAVAFEHTHLASVW